MYVKINRIDCGMLKGETVYRNDQVTFSGEYWPPFMDNTPPNCPLRAISEGRSASFIACTACEWAQVKVVPA